MSNDKGPTTMTRELTYYTLDEHRDSGDLRGFDRREFPELGLCYVSPFDAQRAGDAVFERVATLYRARVDAYDPMRAPYAAICDRCFVGSGLGPAFVDLPHAAALRAAIGGAK